MDVYRLHLAEYAEHFRPGSMRLFSYAAGGLFQRVQQPPGHFHAARSCIHRILREKRPQQEAFLLVSEQKNSGGQAVDFYVHGASRLVCREFPGGRQCGGFSCMEPYVQHI